MAKTINIETKTFVRFWLVIAGMGLVLWLIDKAGTGLMIVAIAAFCALALRPLAKKLDRLDGKRSRSSASSVVAVILVVVGIALVVGLVGPVVVKETSDFLREAPERFHGILETVNINDFGKMLGIADLEGQLLAAARNFSSGIIENFSTFAFDSVGAIINFITGAVLVVVLTVLFMLQGPDLLEKFWKRMSGRSRGATRVWRGITTKMADVVAKYVSGQMLVALLDGTVVTLAVLLLAIVFPNVEPGLAIPMGLMAMVLYLIPMFGPVITTTITSILLLFNSWPAAIIFLVFYVIYMQIESNVISPKIQGKGLDLPPLVILVAIVIGMYAFGLIGTLVAIPIAGCVKVLISEYPKLKAVQEKTES